MTVPRKIGRAAAEVERVVATPAMGTPAVAAAEPTPVGPEPPAPAPEPAPAPAVVAVEAAPVPPPVVPPEPTAPEAPPVVTVAPVPVPAVAAITRPPAIDKATVSAIVGAHRPEVLKCVAAGKKADKAMQGTITLQLQVDAAGRVRAQVQSTLGNPLVASCVVRAASAWKFPARAGDEFANVSYPFTIH